MASAVIKFSKLFLYAPEMSISLQNGAIHIIDIELYQLQVKAGNLWMCLEAVKVLMDREPSKKCPKEHSRE